MTDSIHFYAVIKVKKNLILGHGVSSTTSSSTNLSSVKSVVSSPSTKKEPFPSSSSGA